MGYYIEVPSNLDKAEQLQDLYGAVRVPRPTALSELSDDQALVCVVQNGLFDAIGLVYSEGELQAFSDPSDYRPKTWLVLEKDEAHKLANYKQD